MKEFACGDVVPGCGRTFRGDQEQDVLAAVAQHAEQDHGLVSLPDALVAQVREHIHLVV